MSQTCLLTGRAGRMVATRQPDELARSYHTYLGHPLPAGLVAKYFTQPIDELESPESGLRWFAPPVVAGRDFYEYLGATFDWYYENSWDKFFTVRLLKKIGAKSFTDIGCGSGSFIKLAAEAGIRGSGIEINADAVQQAQRDGLQVHLDSTLPPDFQFSELLCMFQTLEHVPDPLGFVRNHAERSGCRRLIITMPCYESLLGFTSDPLSWPPHHISFWSEKAIRTLAELAGFRVGGIWRQPLSSFKRFRRVWGREGEQPLPESSLTLSANPIASRWHFLKSRIAGRPWACWEHTIVGLLER